MSKTGVILTPCGLLELPWDHKRTKSLLVVSWSLGATTRPQDHKTGGGGLIVLPGDHKKTKSLLVVSWSLGATMRPRDDQESLGGLLVSWCHHETTRPQNRGGGLIVLPGDHEKTMSLLVVSWSLGATMRRGIWNFTRRPGDDQETPQDNLVSRGQYWHYMFDLTFTVEQNCPPSLWLFQQFFMVIRMVIWGYLLDHI